MSGDGRRERRDNDDKGLLWKLPVIKTNELGKLGPAFGIGVGFGLGVGIGFLGGVGIGPGIPGLQLGAGFGAGCGVGAGFGYGMGKGVAHDDVRRYSNVGRPSLENGHLPSQKYHLLDFLVLYVYSPICPGKK
ncbi:chorion class B protein M3A5-like isoform X2 [Papaver somniferum]|uniref:chorion class B protein M3A5-like isoform X2 n=1 Tax=Papaver somniferum TaxID=3469 RepID=UPI000E7018B5|nr:chorion class B protein M3A5-like isoform X2 [Papaver somniferum]